MRWYTIGYGGRTPAEVTSMLRQAGVRTVADIRLRPDRASMGCWTRAKSPEKGLERWLTEAGFGYRSVVELGNLFLEYEDWPERYGRLLEGVGELLVPALFELPGPVCLMCAEKRAAECHRSQVADYLRRTRGTEVVHLE